MNAQTTSPIQPCQSLRRWPRFRLDLPVSLLTQVPSKVVVARGRGTDLNCGGMAVAAEIELAIYEQVAVEFNLPHCAEPVRLRGFIRNRTGHTYGVEFITENDSDYRNVGQLESILATLSSAVQ